MWEKAYGGLVTDEKNQLLAAWASSGSQSLRVVNTGAGNSGDARYSSSASTMLFGMQLGKTYTI